MHCVNILLDNNLLLFESGLRGILVLCVVEVFSFVLVFGFVFFFNTSLCAGIT